MGYCTLAKISSDYSIAISNQMNFMAQCKEECAYLFLNGENNTRISQPALLPLPRSLMHELSIKTITGGLDYVYVEFLHSLLTNAVDVDHKFLTFEELNAQEEKYAQLTPKSTYRVLNSAVICEENRNRFDSPLKKYVISSVTTLTMVHTSWPTHILVASDGKLIRSLVGKFKEPNSTSTFTERKILDDLHTDLHILKRGDLTKPLTLRAEEMLREKYPKISLGALERLLPLITSDEDRSNRWWEKS